MRSIRRRILLPLLPLLGVALTATGLAIYGSVRRDLLGGLDRTLLILARGVGSAVDVKLDGEFEFEREEVENLGFPRHSDDLFYAVRETDGTPVASSFPTPPGSFPDNAEGPVLTDYEFDGRNFRICTSPVTRLPEEDPDDLRDWREAHPGEPLPDPEPRELRVTVGHSLGEIEATLHTLRLRLALGFGALFIVLALLPAGIVALALRSLDRISAEADRVGPESPELRIPEASVDREILPLVAALNRALDRLATAYERQKRFSADAAHELRTPLSALRTRCEVALRRPHGPAELRGALEAAHRLALRLSEIVESFLALSRLERGLPDLEVVDLSELVLEVARLHAPAARAKGVDLRTSASNPVPALGHRGLLAECVSNLVDNAVRYTPSGGMARISTRALPYPMVVVEDTGVGIPEDALGQIFDRLYRVDAARSRADGGAGLGLSIAREIAQLHGGDVVAESRPGQGSRFELRLPGLAAKS